MDTVELELNPFRDGSFSTFEIRIRVNGRPLEKLLKQVERPFARAEGNQRLAGSYQPLTLADVRDDPGHFLGSPRATWFDDGDTVLMGCGCGVWGCWPLTTDITVGDSSVRWQHFRNGHRDWDLSALGPYYFDRRAYERAVAVVAAH